MGTDTIFLSPRTRYQEQGQRTSRTASSPASSGLRNQTAWQNKISGRGRQGTLPIQCRHTNCQPTYCQITHQQHDLHILGKILHDGHQELLPMHAHDKVWVHAIKTLQHSGKRHRTLPPAQHHNTWWVCLLQDPPAHVWAPASGDHCTRTIGKKTEGAPLQPEQCSTWAVDTWVASNHLLSCRWWLWGKIQRGRTHPAPHTNGAKILYMLVWKRRRTIWWTHHQMGLCQQKGAPFDAIVCWQGFDAVPAFPTHCTAGLTAPTRQKDTWHKSPTC